MGRSVVTASQGSIVPQGFPRCKTLRRIRWESVHFILSVFLHEPVDPFIAIVVTHSKINIYDGKLAIDSIPFAGGKITGSIHSFSPPIINAAHKRHTTPQHPK